MLIIMNECMLSIDIQNKPEFIYYDENLFQISMFSSISALIDSQSAKALVCRVYVLCAMYTLHS